MNQLNLLLLLCIAVSAMAFEKDKSKLQETIDNLTWYGQASFSINVNDKIIYIDPLKIPTKAPAADIIFITHSHGDHLSTTDIDKIKKEKTILVCPKSCQEKLSGTGIRTIKLVSPGDTLTTKDIPVIAVPAYNIKKTKFHPKENNWVGYIIEIDGVRLYHAGDTERIPEMKEYNCDIALMPLGQTYTMGSVKEAADAILDINPSIAIPMHYGMYEGKSEDAKKFKTLLTDKIEVVLLKPE